MYCVQNRIYCGVCNKSVLADKYPNLLKSQGHVRNILRNQCTNLTIIKTYYKKNINANRTC